MLIFPNNIYYKIENNIYEEKTNGKHDECLLFEIV